MERKYAAVHFASPARIVLPYTLFGCLYIYGSDYLLNAIVTNINLLSKLQTVKGIGFIVATAGLLYVLIGRYRKVIVDYYIVMLEQKKDADRELRDSAEMSMQLFEYSPLPKFIYNKDYRFLRVNEAACAKYGFSKEEFYSMGIEDIRPKEDLPQLYEALKNVDKRKHVVLQDTYRHTKKNGEVLYVRIGTTEIKYKHNWARIATIIDITEDLNNQNELLKMNKRLNAASTIASIGYWSRDLVSSKIYWSETMYKIFELDPATFELKYENILAHFHRDDRKNFNFDLDEVFNDKEIIEIDHRIITGKNEVRSVIERLSLTRNETGKPIMIEGTVLDVTERKRTRQALIDSNERFEMVAKATNEAIADWDVLHNEMYWGEGFRKIFGHEIVPGDKQLWLRNIHPDDKGSVLKLLTSELKDKTKDQFYIEFRFTRGDGRVAFVQHRGAFVRDANGRVTRAVGAMIDVTESMEKLNRIEQQNERLKEIAWIQSHTVRGPLATLMGMTDLLKNKDEFSVDESAVINGIIESTQKLDMVIHNIVRKAEEINTPG